MIKIMSINLKLGNSSSFSQLPLLFNHISVRFNSSFFSFSSSILFLCIVQHIYKQYYWKEYCLFRWDEGKKGFPKKQQEKAKISFCGDGVMSVVLVAVV